MDLEYVNIAELSDLEMAIYMRKTNYEKFKSLVRMHLSFELDLNTDEFDLPCHEIIYEEKGKMKKWNRLSKKQKHGSAINATGCTSGKTSSASANNSPTEALHQQIDSGFMFHLQELKEFILMEKNITQEGIFRKTGSISRQNDLRQQIHQEKPLDLEKSGYSAHDCATVFKGYLAELSEPLLTDAHYPAHLQIEPLCISTTFRPISSTGTLNKSESFLIERQKREQHLLSSVQLILLLLPEDNRELLQHIIDMLHKVAQKEEFNKMSADNLATLFAPHLICPRNLPPEALHYVARKMSNIIAYMIIRGMTIFGIPAKLATDIKAYCLERKRKKTMSPEQMLDESISDVSTVNTVYTFVNREMTAAAHHTNTTETELAQLYAHIQSLPESSRKRRLIKQFNKQNGQGTPLQLLAVNRLKGADGSRSAKSIGDSIKKHIFHKGLISRTPKRPVPPNLGNETPSFSSTKNPKLRVLFQSPVSDNSSSTPNRSETAYANPLTACCNSNTLSSTSSTNNTTPYQLKSHPLQKSISSISLLHHNTSFKSSTKRALHNPAFISDDGDCQSLNSNASSSCTSHSNSSNNSDEHALIGNSISAPVSRQSSDIDTQNSNDQHLNDPNCCVTPLKLITDAAKQLIHHHQHHHHEKKSVAWDEQKLYEIDEYSNPNTPIQKNSLSNSDLKSRYKSEPNLSKMLKEKLVSNNEMVTPISHKNPHSHKSLTRKLIKGVSMGNLRFPFATPDTTKRLVRSVSTTLKRRTSDDTQSNQIITDGIGTPLLRNIEQQYDIVDGDEDNDDEHTFEILDSNDKEDDSDDNENDNDRVEPSNKINKAYPIILTNHGFSSNSNSSDLHSCNAATSYQHLLLQQSGLYRNLNLITSTPSLLLGRRSMSPITKSTQRMPKAMQESIMTPRSRKPVMVLTTTNGSTEQNQTIYQQDFSSFPEQDEHEVSLDIDVLNNDDADPSDTDDNIDDDVDNDDDDNNDNEIFPVGYKSQRSDSILSRNSLQVHSEDANIFGTLTKHLKPESNQHFVQQSTRALEISDTTGDHPQQTDETEVLSNTFKDYLIRRSGLNITNNRDASSLSQPEQIAVSEEEIDDEDNANDGQRDTSYDNNDEDSLSFHSTEDIENLNESKLSTSLLFCLDGNKPDDTDLESFQSDKALDLQNADTKSMNSIISKEEDANSDAQEPISGILNNDNRVNRLSSNPFIILNNARKRAATNDLEKHPHIFVNNPSMSTFSENQNVIPRKVVTKTSPSDVRLSSPNQASPISSNKVTSNTSFSPSTKSNKENISHKDAENYVLSKKLLISEYSGDTKF